MPLILGTNSIKDTGYDVDNSVRFNSGDSAYMHKTVSFGGATSNQKWTISVWVKRSNSSAAHQIISTGTDSGNQTEIRFEANGKFQYAENISSSETINVSTNALHRDPSAWYHLVCAVDTTQGTASNRVKLYVNGILQTSLSTTNYPTEDAGTLINMGVNTGDGVHNIGRRQYNTDQYFDGYMAEFVWIDGLQLAATSFGEFDSDSPTIWKPIDVSGLTFGNNGCYLDFKDSGNLGNDANGGTDLTEVNLAATDQSTDTCTNNFCTLNPLDHNNVTFSEGNLKGSCGSSGTCRSTMAVNKGKWYWEFKYIDPEGFHGIRATHLGVTVNTFSVKIFGLNDPIEAHINGSQNDLTGRDNMSDNDILNFALDMDNNRFAIGQNGAYDNGSAFSGTTLNYHSITGGHYYSPMIATGSGTGRVCEVNFGSPSFAITSGNADANGYGNFEFAVPSGFFSLCSKNLAEYG
tara:strand:+ start:480 stop:1868 length:1389 start_codon:yes stop_codon:yes gene_type:complete